MITETQKAEMKTTQYTRRHRVELKLYLGFEKISLISLK